MGTLRYGFSGVDIWFHLDIAEQYAAGNLAGGFDVGFAVDKTFYPPLFHFLLVPGYWLGASEFYALVFQVLFLPVAVGSFVFLVFRLRGVTSAFYGGLLLLGSMAFLDRVIQAQPHALDLVLLSWVFYFCLFRKGKGFVVASVLMVWNHGVVAVSALGGVLLAQLRWRRWRLFAGWLIGAFPVIAVSLLFLVSGLRSYGAAVDTDQEYLFWHSITFVPEYLGLLTAGFVVGGFVVYKFLRGQVVSAASKLAVLTVLSAAVMVPMWADRWLQYSTIPLALLILEQAHLSGPKVQLMLKAAIVVSVAYTFGELLLF